MPVVEFSSNRIAIWPAQILEYSPTHNHWLAKRLNLNITTVAHSYTPGHAHKPPRIHIYTESVHRSKRRATRSRSLLFSWYKLWQFFNTVSTIVSISWFSALFNPIQTWAWPIEKWCSKLNNYRRRNLLNRLGYFNRVTSQKLSWKFWFEYYNL